MRRGNLLIGLPPRQAEEQVDRLEDLDDLAWRATVEVVDVEDDPVDDRGIVAVRFRSTVETVGLCLALRAEHRG